MAALQGRHALITGGGSGIGAAIAAALAGQGARLTLAGRNPDRLSTFAATLPNAAALQMDVANAAEVRAGFAALGPVDILVNNAGIAPAKPFLDIDLDGWTQSLQVNMTAAFLCAQAALPAMLDRGWGRIVNIASTAGLTAYKGVAAYVAGKHGLVGLTRALAVEYAKSGITVNAVCPGYTETDIARGALANIQTKTGRSETEARALLAAKNPQGRLVQPDEVANCVLWLCSPGSEAINGQSVPVCGGEVMS